MQINIKYENLSDGEYYVKLDNGEIETALYCNGTTRSGFSFNKKDLKRFNIYNFLPVGHLQFPQLYSFFYLI